MRSHSKFILAALMGVLVLGAIASASASAATCKAKAGSKNYQLCINGSAIEGTTTIGLESPSGTAMTLTPEGNPQPGSFVCQKTGLRNAGLHVAAKASVSLRANLYVSECAPTGYMAVKCQTNATREFRELTGTLGSPESIVAAYSGEMVGFELSSKPGDECTGIDNTRLLTFKGEYECTLHEAQIEAVTHELKCASNASHETRWNWSGSPLAPISYTQTIALSGSQKGEKFSIYEAA